MVNCFDLVTDFETSSILDNCKDRRKCVSLHVHNISKLLLEYVTLLENKQQGQQQALCGNFEGDKFIKLYIK